MSTVLTREAPSACAAGRAIAVASGKPGVGKTWFTLSLARALVLEGRRVLLLDGEPSPDSLRSQLGSLPSHDLTEFLAGRCTLAACTAGYPAGGFAVLASRGGEPPDGLSGAALDHVLAALSEEPSFDTMVIDLATGLDRPVRRIAAWASTLLVVATEEQASLTDAFAVLKLHGKACPGGDARIVINQAITTGSGQRTYRMLARAAATHLGWEPPLAGIIRRDDRVREAVRRRTLLQVCTPDARAALDVQTVAAGLLQPAAA